jgi:hypothetical protein
VLDGGRWAELRREHFVRRVSIKELARRFGIDRNTVRRALRPRSAPVYRRAPAGSKLDPFKPEIHRLLGADGSMTGQRIRELIAPLGFTGGKTIVDDYVREVRPLFATPRTYQRTVLSAGRDLPVRPVEAARRGASRPRAEAQVVGRGGVPGLLVRGRRCADLLHAGRGSAVRGPSLSVVAGALPETLVRDRQSGCRYLPCEI